MSDLESKLDPFSVNGTVYSWGKGEYCLGLSKDKLDSSSISALPCKVEGLKNNCIIAIEAGESCSAAINNEGHLLLWGSNYGGRLGLKSNIDHISIPTRVLGLLAKQFIIQVSIGENHVGCVTKSGLAYLWGKGGKACLGDENIKPHTQETPRLLDSVNNIKSIECGYQNSAVITTKGECLVFGSNEYGKLGTVENVIKPSTLKMEESVKSICLGSLYSGLVTESGKLYMFGYGMAGNLGLGIRKSYNQPQLVKSLDKEVIVSVACTRSQINPLTSGNVEGQENPHTFAITDQGKLYAFGTAHKGMLGNLSKKTLVPTGCDELLPYLIGGPLKDSPTKSPSNYFSDSHIVSAISSSIHSCAIDSNGGAYSWGCMSDGRGGVLKYLTGLTGGRSRLKCYISSPTRIHGLDDKLIVGISAARRHMLALVVEKPTEQSTLKVQIS